METSAPERSGLILHWLLFFVICFGLGYPSVGRFDARSVALTRLNITN